MKTYYVVIHGAIFDYSEDENIANRIADLYRKIGWKGVMVTTQEPT